MATLRTSAAPSFRTEADAAHHIASCLHMVAGIESPRRDSNYDEVRQRLLAVWGAKRWQRVYKQARSEAWDRDGFGGVR